MALSQTVTTTQTTEVKLKPTLKKKLLLNLKTYQSLRDQLKAIEAAMDKHKAVVQECMNEAEEEKLSIDGFKTTMVFGVNSRLDKELFVQQGGTLAQLANATVTKPSRPYCKISCPGDKSHDE